MFKEKCTCIYICDVHRYSMCQSLWDDLTQGIWVLISWVHEWTSCINDNDLVYISHQVSSQHICLLFLGEVGNRYTIQFQGNSLLTLNSCAVL